jgi:hypothetical protein
MPRLSGPTGAQPLGATKLRPRLRFACLRQRVLGIECTRTQTARLARTAREDLRQTSWRTNTKGAPKGADAQLTGASNEELNEFDTSHRRIVAMAGAELEDPGVSTITGGVARSNFGEQL